MDPISAMKIAIIVSGLIVHGGWDAGVDQAKAEARHAADAIRKDLRKRRKAWAKQLETRLADGRKGGPATALWWGWAAIRTAKGLRRVMRREPRAAEKAVRGTTGPFQRIFTAAWRGAQYARDEARQQREAHEARTPREPVGVCGRCGTVAAKSALVWALTRFDRQERMCAKCRAAVDAERASDKENTAAAASTPEPDVADADVIHDSLRPAPDTPHVEHEPHNEAADPPPPGPSHPSRGNTGSHTRTAPPPPPSPPRSDWKVTVTRADDPGHTSRPEPVEAPARPALETGRVEASNTETEGDEVASRSRSLVPTRAISPATRNAALARRSGGDSHTHGKWEHATTDIYRRLEMLPSLLEAMLRSLNHASAGRSQVNGVMAFYEGAVLFMGQVQDTLRVVGTKEKPVVEAVTTAGGPDEIPNIPYFRDI